VVKRVKSLSLVLLVAVAACSTPPPATTSLGASAAPAGARPDHVVVVVFENKAFGQVDGSARAPYLNLLGRHSAVYTDLHAETHPSQPNYIALFSGDPHGVTSDACPVRLNGQPNLGRQLIDAGYTFTGFSEALPRPGFTGCTAGKYAAKHNPWVDFDNVPAAANQPASALPADYAALPTVSFWIPDLCDDMHDCSVSAGDQWSQRHLDPYAHWAQHHNSALIVTFDEDNHSDGNRIFTLVAGAGVTAGRYPKPATHYDILATIEQWYGLPRLGHAKPAAPLPYAWTASSASSKDGPPTVSGT
jgi:phosphatidylinositol-3-phosphatase